MITNLLAILTFSLSTNVTVTDNTQYRYDPVPCPEGLTGCLVYHSEKNTNAVLKQATHRYEQTTVKELCEVMVALPLSYNWKIVHTDERVVTNYWTVFSRPNEWKKESVTTETPFNVLMYKNLHDIHDIQITNSAAFEFRLKEFRLK